jgi:tRNA-specific 2-thiouridylase
VAVQIRYRTAPVGATLFPEAEAAQRVKLVFDQPQFGVTPGQAAVWYDGDRVLGGGLIEPFTTDPRVRDTAYPQLHVAKMNPI